MSASKKSTINVSRRAVLGNAVSASTVALIPLGSVSCSSSRQPPPRVLNADAQAVLESFVDRLVPADENGPGALEAGSADYINRSLAQWNNEERPMLEAGLRILNDHARSRFGRDFPGLEDEEKDAIMMDMEAGNLADFDNGPGVFNRLHRLTLEGMFCDPYYGGNRDYIGWDLIGYPGAVLASTPEMQRMNVRLPSLQTSAYGEDFDGH